MKKILVLVALSFFIFVSYKLFTDDDLDPEIVRWNNYYSKIPNLENNAFIGLIALGLDSEEPYDDAISLYFNALEQFNNGEMDVNSKLEYPLLPKAIEQFNSEKYCSFTESTCRQYLKEHRDKIELELSNIESILAQLYQISNYDNFDMLDPAATALSYNLREIYWVASVQIFYLIQDQKLQRAAQLITKLASFDRKLQAAESYVVFRVVTIVNYLSTYIPLILELKANGFSQWSLIEPIIEPLRVSDITMNGALIQLNSVAARGIKIANDKASLQPEKSYLKRAINDIKYKENMTFNSKYKQLKVEFIPENVTKGDLILQYKTAQVRRKAYIEQQEKEFENLALFAFNNYRNTLGQTFIDLSDPDIIDITMDMVRLDIHIMLLRIIIQSEHAIDIDTLKARQYINPYTGEGPFVSDSQLCYQMEERVCLNL
jgi:hypothetical protein